MLIYTKSGKSLARVKLTDDKSMFCKLHQARLFCKFCFNTSMFLVVSFKRPDRIVTTSARVKPFTDEQPKVTRKRKKPGDSK